MAERSKTTTKANLYTMLSKVQDPHMRQLFKFILDQTGNINDQTPNIGKVSQPLDQHMDANGNHIQNLKDPVDQQDAATKAYIDRQIQTLAAKVNL